MRTADLVPLVQPGAALYPLLAVSGGRYSAMGGGVPLTSEGQVIAGVGVSGGTTEQDIAIVEAAMTKPVRPQPERNLMPNPTILLVHGAFGDASSWRPVFDRLRDDGHTVIAGRDSPAGGRGRRRPPLGGHRPDRRARSCSPAIPTAAQ